MVARTYLWIPLCMLALGCWVGSDEVASKVSDLPADTDTDTDTDTDADTDTDTDTDTDVEWPELVLSGIDPNVGSNAGGQVLTVTVGPLDPEDVTVLMGGVEATILETSEEWVRIETPRLSLQGAASVEVRSAERTARLSDAYFFWADGSGLAGAVGTVANYDLDRSYDLDLFFGGLDENDPPQEQSAQIVFVEPSDWELWQLYAPELDMCVLNSESSAPGLTFLKPGFSSIELGGVDLEVNESGNEYLLPRRPGSWSGTGAVSLEVPNGEPGWLETSFEPFVTVPQQAPVVVRPALDGFSAPTDVRNGFALQWQSVGAGDFIVVQMYRYKGGERPDDVTCVLEDDGLFYTPSDLFSGWTNGRPVAIAIGRAKRSDAILPWNNSEARVYGMHWWYGGFYQRE
ncbi:MAG: IPT/TIG domain-containing protein [Myxococcota bacterium]